MSSPAFYRRRCVGPLARCQLRWCENPNLANSGGARRLNPNSHWCKNLGVGIACHVEDLLILHFFCFCSVWFRSPSGEKKPRKGLCVCPPVLCVFSPPHPRRVCSRDHDGEACEAEEL